MIACFPEEGKAIRGWFYEPLKYPKEKPGYRKHGSRAFIASEKATSHKQLSEHNYFTNCLRKCEAGIHRLEQCHIFG